MKKYWNAFSSHSKLFKATHLDTGSSGFQRSFFLDSCRYHRLMYISWETKGLLQEFLNSEGVMDALIKENHVVYINLEMFFVWGPHPHTYIHFSIYEYFFFFSQQTMHLDWHLTVTPWLAGPTPDPCNITYGNPNRSPSVVPRLAGVWVSWES